MIRSTNTIEGSFRIIPAVATGVIAGVTSNYFGLTGSTSVPLLGEVSNTVLLGGLVGSSTFFAENVSKWVLPKIGLGTLSSQTTQMIAIPAVAGLTAAGAVALLNTGERDPQTIFMNAAIGGASYVAGKYVGDFAANAGFAY
jgi:hypothetical protein